MLEAQRALDLQSRIRSGIGHSKLDTDVHGEFHSCLARDIVVIIVALCFAFLLSGNRLSYEGFLLDRRAKYHREIDSPSQRLPAIECQQTSRPYTPPLGEGVFTTPAIVEAKAFLVGMAHLLGENGIERQQESPACQSIKERPAGKEIGAEYTNL